MKPKSINFYCALSLAVASAYSPNVLAVSINEVRIDQPSTDTDEYFELKGLPNESLDGLSYIVLGDGAGGSGTIESVTSLDGLSLDASGLFFAAKTSFTLGTPDLTTTFSFENSDNVTHLLVDNFTGSNGDDLDSDDDGVLDNPPFTSVVDSIALKENDSGELLYSDTIVGPDGSFVPGHSFLCADGWRIGEFAPGTSDTPGAENLCDDDGGSDPVVVELSIPETQGSGEASPFEGQVVKTQGVVSADFQGSDQLRGFYLQDPLGDDNATTSDGIFVFTPSGDDVNVGDEIEIIAEADEFFGLTQLRNVESITVLSSNNILSPTALSLPETVDGELERYEGMLVEVVSPMTVSQNFFLSRFGQLTLSSPDDLGNPGRLFQPTNQFAASSQEAIDLADSNARRTLILDDGQDISGFGDNPEPVPYISNPPSVLRGGDTVNNLVGILDYGRINPNNPPGRDYRLQPTQAPIFQQANLREPIPKSANGEITIASFNVLNYFSSLDGNGQVCGPQADQDCRGADSASELVRQQDKIVSALFAMNADIVGLVEIENNGYAEGGAIRTLVDALNQAYGQETYDIVQPTDIETLGTDAIAVGFIYKPASVEPIGVAATLASGAFDQTLDGGRSRQPLAVSFKQINNDEIFTAVINHLKSKRPPSEPQNNGNDDQGDGQGSWNLRRTEAANDLATWLQTTPTGIDDEDILIIGDLNAYAEEDPMLAFEAGGYQDLIQVFNGDTGYSFTFDGLAGSLDHALANDSLAEQVGDVVEWHINTDEPPVLDYNEEFNPEGYYNVDPFRSSDHDPVIVGLNLFTEPLDSDQDGVNDDLDQCSDTANGQAVLSDGCSVTQALEKNCEPLFAEQARQYLRCVYRTAVKAYREELLSRQQARQLYYRAIFRVIYSRYFSKYH